MKPRVATLLLTALLLSGCGDDTPPAGSCGPSSCSGCCLGDVCDPGNPVAACGTAGQGCFACAAGESCVAGVCAKPSGCSPASCPSGCCYSGVCMPGDNASLCGQGGASCVVCKDGERCTNRSCQATACTPATCASGCCDSKGNCVSGTSEAACGSGGLSCSSCPTGSICANHACQSAPTCSCPGGCCDAAGTCQPGSAPSACGTGGGACVACGSNQTCVQGKCSCGPGACPGCCQNNQCKTGDQPTACGKGGAACTTCSGGDVCSGGSCSSGATCSAASCKDGCCQNNTCQTNAQAACGIFGGSCQKCGFTESCNAGVCNNSLLCNSYFCGKGCCKDSTCQPGDTAQACGANGQVCKVCSASETCVGGGCVAKVGVKWDVTVVKAMLSPGTSWDNPPKNPPPDPYVTLTVGGQTKSTSSLNDTYTPVWDEYLLTDTTQNLSSSIHLVVGDADDFWKDDIIADCTINLTPLDLVLGQKTITSCGGSKDLLSLTLKFSPSIYL